MADRRRGADEAGADVEALAKADLPLIQEAWYRLLYEGQFRLRQSLHIRPRLVRPPPSVRHQALLYRLPFLLPIRRLVLWVPACGETLVDESPR